MAELLVSITTPDHNIAELNLQMNTFVPVAIPPSEMISDDLPNALTVGSDGKLVASAITLGASELISIDTPNNLSLGSDNKLVSQPPDIDFLAHYILASN